MPVFKDHSFRFGASGGTAEVYDIEKSIRFEDGNSPILKKTFSSAGTEETFTFSCWVKRSNVGSGLGNSNLGVTLFSGGPNVSNYGEIVFRSNGYGVQDSLHFYYSKSGSISAQLVTSRLFTDPHAWYHIVCVMDTTNEAEGDRMRIYVNGERESAFSTETYPAKDAVPDFNTASEHGIGGFAVSTDYRFFEGYLAEIKFLDGYAYDSSYFGEFNSDNIWIPKEYTDSYGQNGFYINAQDSSNLGHDYQTEDRSGTTNDFTATNLGVYDQVPDSPTNNWCVLSTINKTPSIGIFNGGLGHNYYSNQYNDGASGSLMVPNSGKWYWEQIVIAANIYGGYAGFKTQGVTNRKHTPTNVPNGGGSTVGRWGNRIFKDGPSVELLAGTPSAKEVTGIMIDLDNYTVQFYEDGSTIGSAVSIASTYSGWLPFISTNTVGSEQGVAPLQTGYTANFVARVNFGQDSTFGGVLAGNTHTDANGLGNFKKQPPTDALAICTRNIITGLT